MFPWSFSFFFLSFYGKLNTVCQSLVLALKQALDVKSSPGSRGGCPLVNLSSPRHTVEPRRPLLIYTLRGMIGRRPGRQPLLRVWTTSQHRADGLRGLAGGGGATLETVQGGGNKPTKTPSQYRAVMELWEGGKKKKKKKKTQPLLLLSNPAEGQASTQTLTELVMGELCPPCLFVCVVMCVCVSG